MAVEKTSPTKVEELNFDDIDENIQNTIKPILEEFKTKYPESSIEINKNGNDEGDDQHIYVNIGNTITLKFDSKTGELLSKTENNMVTNMATNNVAATEYMAENISTKGRGWYGGIDTMNVPVPYLISQTIKDKDGNNINNQVFLESEIPGEYEIWQIGVDGEMSQIGLAEKDINGGNHIEKHLTSLDGTTTDTVYADDKSGNVLLREIITDKNGKVLMNLTKQRKQISENHYQTGVNNQWTDVVISNDKVVITRLDKDKNPTDEKIEYSVRDFSKEEHDKIFKELECLRNNDNIEDNRRVTRETINKFGLDFTIDKKVLPMLHQLSGEEWINMANSGTKIVINTNMEPNNAFSAGGLIGLSDEMMSDLSIFEHELGHEKFGHLRLDKDETLRQIYEEEKKQFTTTFPDKNINSISYFLAKNEPDTRGVNECCAETNLLLNTKNSSWNIIQDRTHLLQQYFPRTVAYLSTKLLEVNK